MLTLRNDDQRLNSRFEGSRCSPALVAATPSPCRVLVVDDDEWMRDYLNSILKSAGYDVEVSASGREALRLLRVEPYDILLTDCQMPDLDGLTLCKRVRLEYPDMYVLMFTIKNTRADRYAGLTSGADEYVIKGVPKSEMLAKVNVGRRIRSIHLALADCDLPNRQPAFADPLTNAPNVEYFDRQMAKEILRAQRGRRAFSVLNCQIERLQHIARLYGHPAADEALRAFADNTRRCLRPGRDWFARIGEDRFVVILPRTRFEGAERMARKLLRRFSAVLIAAAAGAIRCTVNIDITAFEPWLDWTALRDLPVESRGDHERSIH